MEDALIIARENVRKALNMISAGDSVQFNALDGAKAKVLAEGKIAYHSRFQSPAHRAAVIAWQEVLDGAYDEPADADEADEGDVDANLAAAYADFTPGSTGFAIAVETHCGFQASREEIKRIAERARNAAEFVKIWQNENWWADDAQ